VRILDLRSEDWYFHLPLWLLTPCCGEVLWAFNPAHLDFIEESVQAEIRDSWGNERLASRLPEWIKRRANREDVLRCVGKLGGS
jgi:hypothetical protein